MIDNICRTLEAGEDIRGQLIALRQEIKGEQELEQWRDYHSDHPVLYGFLSHDDPKVRKNAALLLGKTEGDSAVQALFEAYEQEETLFVRSAYLEAMLGLNVADYGDALRKQAQHLMNSSPEEGEKKHIHEEMHRLLQLIRNIDGVKRHKFTGYDIPVEVLLTTTPNYQKVTQAQLPRGTAKTVNAGVLARTDDLRQILTIRTFRELLFVLQGNHHISGTPQQIAGEILSTNLLDLLEQLHEGEFPYSFRLDVKGAISSDKRSMLIHRVAEQLEQQSGYRLYNAPDDYELEIRMMIGEDESIHPILKLYTIPMRRFSYRKQSVAASIHPATAALLMQLAKPYLKEGAQVLDPFCGVGTMLIERDMLVPAGDMYGTDIFGEAILKARENALAAGRNVNYINRDFFDFTHKYLFDEIVTNMPVRGKKSKEQQDRFYSDFFDRAGQFLKPGGVLVMYTNEMGFVKKQLRLHREYSMSHEYLIRKKDEFYLYVIKYKG
ncbi:MAG: methyltransferase [Roseburia sp.]